MGSWTQIRKNLLTLAVTFVTGGRALAAVTIYSPPTATTVTNPVHVVAIASDNIPIAQLQLFDNDKLIGAFPGSMMDRYYLLAPGPHNLVVTEVDEGNHVIVSSSSYVYIATPPGT